MQDLLSMFLLICASMGSLALGVLLAYLACSAGFSALKSHALSYANTPQVKSRTAPIS